MREEVAESVYRCELGEMPEPDITTSPHLYKASLCSPTVLAFTFRQVWVVVALFVWGHVELLPVPWCVVVIAGSDSCERGEGPTVLDFALDCV